MNCVANDIIILALGSTVLLSSLGIAAAVVVATALAMAQSNDWYTCPDGDTSFKPAMDDDDEDEEKGANNVLLPRLGILLS